MSGILILTNPEDLHSYVVREALRRKSAEPWLWHISDFPTLQAASSLLEGREATWEIVGPELTLQNQQIRTVWLRRPEPPVLPAHLDREDRPFALRECNLFLRSLYEEIGGGAFWVNPPASQRRALLRPVQLRAAMRTGLRVPRTLCSNDPVRIRGFLRGSKTGVIYKSFFPVSWSDSEGISTLFTAVVQEADLPQDGTLRATPGIFQELVPKKYELRVTAIGNRLFAAKLRSQEVPAAMLDWRAASESVPTEPFELPERVSQACRAIMADLGIVFGCFDLIVTPQGDYVFLEVNEMGAFLWLEQRLPEMGMLDAFCEFLIQGKVDFEWRQSASGVEWQDVIGEAEHHLQVEAPKKHVIRNEGRKESRAPEHKKQLVGGIRPRWSAGM